MGGASFIQSIGAFTLWLFAGFKNYKFYRYERPGLSFLIGIISTLTIFYILIMFTDLFKME